MAMGMSFLVGCGGSGDGNSDGSVDAGTNNEKEQEILSEEERISRNLEEFMDSVVLDGMYWLEAKGDVTMGYYCNEDGKYSSSNIITQTDDYIYYGGIRKEEALYEDASGERKYFVDGVTRHLNLIHLYVVFNYVIPGCDEVYDIPGLGEYQIDSFDALKEAELIVNNIDAHINWNYWHKNPEYQEVAPLQAEWLEGAMPYLIENECETIEDIMKAWELDVLEPDAFRICTADSVGQSEFSYNTKYGTTRFVVNNQMGTDENYLYNRSLTVIFEDEEAECGYIQFTEYAEKNEDDEMVRYLDYKLTREKYTEE